MKKEFFTLLLQEILSPDFGMFVEDDESHILWFRNNVSVICYQIALASQHFQLLCLSFFL